ncbi:glycine cleavage system aminomethyltransferase GcvT [Anaerovorax sp. IOR16]|uniref:glycine cleavage system aminomethyltransferase GcvT n=1 Tax=Anaerovorax sp. IOR16 TaxID=2773458 RepID=UPI0019D0C049|nr:glycine cleavage system aminomethyltransferase GcvT [Anaerovorax sp. IOR16]
MERKTPLYDCHVECGGKMVPFAGFLLPVQYQTGVIAEHNAVRTKAGLFDVSHMGELLLFGADALDNLQMLLTNDFTNMNDGQCRYTLLCNKSGGIVDDLLVYRMEKNQYLLVINAANVEKDERWIREHIFGDVTLKNLSSELAQVALQGPLSLKILAKLCMEESLPKKYYTFVKDINVGGINALISKTGYTGEDGYELYCQAEDAPNLWNKLLEAGKEDGLIPCGLGARDTLRFEAAMPLYGHEMNDEITPFEADLNFAVKMQKRDFIGKEALQNKGERTRKRVGLKILSRGIAREESVVFFNDTKIGITTSGTHCPFLKTPYAMALLDMEYTKPGTRVQVEVRGRMLDAEVVELPFYKKDERKK